MKTKLSFIFAVVACIGVHTAAHSYKCTKLSSCPTLGVNGYYLAGGVWDTGAGCRGTTKTCYQVEDGSLTYHSIIEVETCNTCYEQYRMTNMTDSSPYCDNVLEYQKCDDLIQSTPTCGSIKCDTGTWWETNGAWATKKSKGCVNGACTTSTLETECAIGYGDDNQGNCIRCKSPEGIYGLTPGYGYSDNDCYIPKDTVFSNSTGRGVYNSDCYWNRY